MNWRNAQQTSTKSGGNALIDLAKDDTNTMIVQVEEYTQFLEGSAPVRGSGPNLVARAEDSRHEQMKTAKEYVKVARDMEAIKLQMQEENNDNICIPSKRGKYKAPQNTAQSIQGKTYTRQKKRHQKVPKGALMRRFTDTEEILETNEVEIISDEEPVPPKKKKAAKKTKTSANEVPVPKCPKKSPAPATKKTGPSTVCGPYSTHNSQILKNQAGMTTCPTHVPGNVQ